MAEDANDGLTDNQRVVHELNNALMAINGYAEVALNRVPGDDPLHSVVTEIQTAGLRASDLVRTLAERYR